MATNTSSISVADICKNINDEMGKIITAEVINLFLDNGLTYKIKDDGSRYRIFCYIKKSKESLIIGTFDKRRDFIVQLRIADMTIFDKLDNFTENIRNSILNGPDCIGPNCRNCDTAYDFKYHDKEYRKCHTLYNNFVFANLQQEDISVLTGIIENEIRFKLPRKKDNTIAISKQ